MEEFLNSALDTEETESLTQTNRCVEPTTSDNNIVINQPRVAQEEPLSLPAQLGKKTIDEVWFEINKDHPEEQDYNSIGRQRNQHQQTFAQMTLEDFLVKAGVVQGASGPLQTNYTNFQSSHTSGLGINFGMGTVMSSGLSTPHIDAGNLSSNSFTAYQMLAQGCSLVGQSSENVDNGTAQSALMPDGQKNKKKRMDSPHEMVVERRQRRMIKNRESAARSRARKQAYTVELEIELHQLREENEKLKLHLSEAEMKRKQELLRAKYSTKAQKVEQKLKRMRRTNSLTW